MRDWLAGLGAGVRSFVGRVSTAPRRWLGVDDAHRAALLAEHRAEAAALRAHEAAVRAIAAARAATEAAATVAETVPLASAILSVHGRAVTESHDKMSGLPFRHDGLAGGAGGHRDGAYRVLDSDIETLD